MTSRLAFVTFAIVASLAPAAALATGQQTQTQTAQPGEEEQLSAADDLRGTQVRDPQGQVIGTIEELVIDPGEGTVAYMIVALPQYAGEQVIIPWKALQAAPSGMSAPAFEGERAVVLDMPRSELLQAPETGVETLNRDQERQIHRYYGVSPYWQEDQQPPGMMQQAPPLPPGHPPVLPPGHPPIAPEGAR